MFVRNSQQAGLHEMSTNLIDSVVNKKDPFRETKFNFIEQGKDPKEMSKSFSKKRKNEKSITVPKTFRDKLFVDKLIKKSEHNNKLKDSLILPLLNQDM